MVSTRSIDTTTISMMDFGYYQKKIQVLTSIILRNNEIKYKQWKIDIYYNFIL